MNGRTLLIALIVGTAGFASSGCSNGQPRFKGIDAYQNATTPNKYGPVQGIDPYSYGGTAYASGGLNPGASYGTGANGAYDGNPAHYARVVAVNGSSAPPVDWGSGKKDADTSGIVVPEAPKPIGD